MAAKKGQVSVFFILAIILILLGGVYFYNQRITIKEPEIMQPDIEPIKSFIETCIEQTATEALTILGLNGGYIDFPFDIEANPRSYLQEGPIDEIKNPYWWYDGINAVPTEEFMARQLENYINNNLGNCLSSFDAFKSQFDIKILGEKNAKVTFAESDVIVDIDFPIDVLRKENSSRIRFEKFSKTVPIRLKRAYEFAKKIMEAENRDRFIERKTIDLMVLDKDIPTTDIEATCEKREWKFNEVKDKLIKLLRVNLPYIRVSGSKYANDIFVPTPFGEDTYAESYYQNHYLWEVADEKFPDLKAAFTFNENWPFDFQSRPRDGNLLKSNAQKGFQLLDFFCLHMWHFTYDAAFPVKVTVTDSDSIRPYTFSFAFKVGIDHNQPNRQDFATTIFETAERPSTEEFCNEVRNAITIYTLSNTTEEQLDLAEVDLTLTCGAYTCDLGKSDWLSFGAASGLTIEAPYCVNAILRGKKEGFLDAQEFIQTDRPNTHNLYMKPIKEFRNYKVVKHQFVNPSIEGDLVLDEKASIQIKAIDRSFEAFGAYPTEGEFSIKLLNEKATYDVLIYLSNNDDILGGYRQNWTVNVNDLENADQIVFHVLEQGIVPDDERAEFIINLEKESKKIPLPGLK